VNTLAARFCTAWAIAVAGGALGAGASYQLDLPTGAAIVCALGILLLLVQVFSGFRRVSRRSLIESTAPVERQFSETMSLPRMSARKGPNP